MTRERLLLKGPVYASAVAIGASVAGLAAQGDWSGTKLFAVALAAGAFWVVFIAVPLLVVDQITNGS